VNGFIVILLIASIATILLGLAWLAHITDQAIRQRYRRAVATAAAEMVLRQPEHLARVIPLLPGMLERFPAPAPAEEPLEYAELVVDGPHELVDGEAIAAVTGAIPVTLEAKADTVDPYADIITTLHTAPREKLEQYAADLERRLQEARNTLMDAADTVAAVEQEAEAKITHLQDVVRRKDRTRATYLRRIRRVDAVIQTAEADTGAVFAVLHPTLARAAA
jgi:hypothetical protein